MFFSDHRARWGTQAYTGPGVRVPDRSGRGAVAVAAVCIAFGLQLCEHRFVRSDASVIGRQPGPGVTIITLTIAGFFIFDLLDSRSLRNSACPIGTIFTHAHNNLARVLSKKDRGEETLTQLQRAAKLDAIYTRFLPATAD